MPVTVEVSDPNGVVSYVNLLTNGPDAVVLLIGTNRKPELDTGTIGSGGKTLRLNGASITVRGVPFIDENPIDPVEIVEWGCLWTIARRQNARTLYTKEHSHASL